MCWSKTHLSHRRAANTESVHLVNHELWLRVSVLSSWQWWEIRGWTSSGINGYWQSCMKRQHLERTVVLVEINVRMKKYNICCAFKDFSVERLKTFACGQLFICTCQRVSWSGSCMRSLSQYVCTVYTYNRYLQLSRDHYDSLKIHCFLHGTGVATENLPGS